MEGVALVRTAQIAGKGTRKLLFYIALVQKLSNTVESS